MSRKRDKPYGGKLAALDTLFGEAPTAAAELMPISQIVPSANQPRRYFGDEELTSLVASVRDHGVLQPLLVRPLDNDQFCLVAGERRFRAAKEAGLDTVPVVIRELDDEQAYELALLENLQREDLNPVEETDAVLTLLAMRLDKPIDAVLKTIRELRDVGRGRAGNNVVTNEEKAVIEGVFATIGKLTLDSFYTHRLPLLKLPTDILNAVRSAGFAYTKARELGRITDDEARTHLLQRALDENLSLAELKAAVKNQLDTQRGKGVEIKPALVQRVKGHLSDKRIGKLPEKRQREIQKLLEKLEALLVTSSDADSADSEQMQTAR